MSTRTLPCLYPSPSSSSSLSSHAVPRALFAVVFAGLNRARHVWVCLFTWSVMRTALLGVFVHASSWTGLGWAGLGWLGLGLTLRGLLCFALPCLALPCLALPYFWQTSGWLSPALLCSVLLC